MELEFEDSSASLSTRLGSRLGLKKRVSCEIAERSLLVLSDSERFEMSEGEEAEAEAEATEDISLRALDVESLVLSSSGVKILT